VLLFVLELLLYLKSHASLCLALLPFAKDTIVAYDNEMSNLTRAHRFGKIDGEVATIPLMKVASGSMAFVK
jgi:hypothetical protein